MKAPANQPEGLDGIADELYALRPDAFAAARDEQMRQARAEKRQPLARELGRLRRPTQSAWLVNLLWREKRELLEELLDLGSQLSRAQAEASGPTLLRLTARRRELEAALLREARALGERAGVGVTPSMEREVQETLAAALAVPAVAEELRTGRLLKPAAYAGFGTLLPFPTPAQPARPPREEADSPDAAAAPPRREEAAERVAGAREREEEARAREEEEARLAAERRGGLERAVTEARAGLQRAAGALAERTRAAGAAERQYQTLRSRVEQLRQQLETIEAQASAAGRAATAASSSKVQAETAHDAAVQVLAAAEDSLANVR